MEWKPNRAVHMVKTFFTGILLLLLSVSLAGVHLWYGGAELTQETLSDVTGVTGFSAPSLSVAYYEPRVLLYDEISNPAYPQMQPMNRMDFVYEK